MTTTEIQPIVLDEFPVDNDDAAVNVWVREGEAGAVMSAISKEDDEAEVRAALDEHELLAVALSCASALKAIGCRGALRELITEVVALL